MQLTHYDITGRITGVVTTEHQLTYDLNKTGLYVEGGADLNTEYVDAGVIKPRPACPAVLTGYQLTHLPAPCTITIGDSGYQATETVVDLEFDQPGVYTIKIEAWPYLDKEFTIEN
jgi:hypothetical protein